MGIVKKYKDLKYPRNKKCFLCRKVFPRIDLIEHECKLRCPECHKLVKNKEPTINEVKIQMRDAKFQKGMLWHISIDKEKVYKRQREKCKERKND